MKKLYTYISYRSSAETLWLNYVRNEINILKISASETWLLKRRKRAAKTRKPSSASGVSAAPRTRRLAGGSSANIGISAAAASAQKRAACGENIESAKAPHQPATKRAAGCEIS